MDIVKSIYKWWFNKVPGLASVIMVFTLIYQNLFETENDFVIVSIYIFAIVIYFIAGKLDEPFYDKIFSTNNISIFRECGIVKKLHKSRLSALKNIDPKFKDTKGIYSTCRKIIPSEKWVKEIKPFLEISKVSRCFFAISIILMVFLLIGKIIGYNIPSSIIPDKIEILIFDLKLNLLVLIASYALFISCRYIHQLNLFNTISKLNFEFLTLPIVGGNESIESTKFLIVDERFVKWDELPIVKSNKLNGST